MNFSADEYALLKRYGVVIFGNNHYYKLDLERKIYNLDYSKPLFFKVGMMSFRTNNWQKLIIDLLSYFINELDVKIEQLEKFTCEWTKRTIFSINCEDKRYWKELCGIGYVYMNFSSTHLYFLLTDFLEYINVEKNQIEFLVNLPSSSEPKAIYNLFYNKYIYELKIFLEHEKKYNIEKETAFLGWVKIIDKNLHKIAPSKKSFLTIEDIYDLNTSFSRLMRSNPFRAENKVKSYEYVLKAIKDFKKKLISNGEE